MIDSTTAPKHEKQDGVFTMTTSRPINSADNVCTITRTLTPLEQYDLEHFGHIIDDYKEFEKDGAYYSFYNNISVTGRN